MVVTLAVSIFLLFLLVLVLGAFWHDIATTLDQAREAFFVGGIDEWDETVSADDIDLSELVPPRKTA